MSSLSDSKEGGGGSGAMGMNMVTTVMAFSVSAFFVLFVFVRLLCARLHFRTDRDAAHAGDAFVVQPNDVELGIRGMEASAVTGFPTVKLSDGTRRQEEPHCPVCLEEYAAKDVVRVLPACGHAFHAACIDAWLRQQPTCPVCRASMRATAKNQHHRATTLDHSPVVAVATVTRVPISLPQQDPASPPRAGADQTDASRLEIVPEGEEPGSSADQQQSAGVFDRSGCRGETARQSTSERDYSTGTQACQFRLAVIRD